MEINDCKEYSIQVKLYNFFKGTIIEEINCYLNDNHVFSLTESIKNKQIESFGNSLLINEMKFKLTKYVKIKIIINIKNSKELILSDEITLENIEQEKEIKTEKLNIHFKFILKRFGINKTFKTEFDNEYLSNANKISNHQKTEENVFNQSKEKELDIFNEKEKILLKENKLSLNDSNLNYKNKIVFNEDLILREINILNQKISDLEKINQKQKEEIELLNIFKKEQIDMNDIHIIKIKKIEKNMKQTKMLLSPMTIKYMFEYFISIAHKKFIFGYKEQGCNSNKLNEILESIYYYIEGPNLISEDVKMEFLQNFPYEAKKNTYIKERKSKTFFKKFTRFV